jgi:hypothetical protein
MKKAGKLVRWVAVFDTHGDMIDPGAEQAFNEFVKGWKPTVRIAGGDHFDYRSLRRGAKGTEEERERLGGDHDAGCAFLRSYKPTVFLRGNHDERLWDAAKSGDGKLFDLASYMVPEVEAAIGPNCAMLPYDKRAGVYTLGDTRFVHGYASGIYAARQVADIYGRCVMGHVHAVSAHHPPSLDRRAGYTSGCLCKLDMDYNRSHMRTLAHGHGWAYGVLTDSGHVQVWLAQRTGNDWLFPSEMRIVS